jgi:predicted negative regulator of RcsB-dependent stress response
MYPTILIIIFMLFFAVLAFGWFYWQRAKARAAGESTDVASATADATPAPTEADAPASSDMATAANDQQ